MSSTVHLNLFGSIPKPIGEFGPLDWLLEVLDLDDENSSSNLNKLPSPLFLPLIGKDTDPELLPNLDVDPKGPNDNKLVFFSCVFSLFPWSPLLCLKERHEALLPLP